MPVPISKTEQGLTYAFPGFWGNQYQRAFFDVRVCNPNAQSYCNSSLKTVYEKQER